MKLTMGMMALGRDKRILNKIYLPDLQWAGFSDELCSEHFMMMAVVN